MINLLIAEWKKAVRNVKLISFLVWIFPVGVFAFATIAIVLGLIVGGQDMFTCTGKWTESMTSSWAVITGFPGNVFGRMLPLAFMSVVFAGEYVWGTWKNVLPRNTRNRVLSSKLVIQVFVILISIAVMSLFVGAGHSLACTVNQTPIGPTLNGESMKGFLIDYSREAFLATIALLMLAAFAALGAILTRTILGGLLVSFGLSLFELTSLGLLHLLSLFFKNEGILKLYQYTPSFSIDNLRSWLNNGYPLPGVLPGSDGIGLAMSSGDSFLILLIWLAVFISLALISFNRQDITS